MRRLGVLDNRCGLLNYRAVVYIAVIWFFSSSSMAQDTALWSWWHSGREDNFTSTKPSWSMPVDAVRWSGEEIVGGRRQEGYRLYRLEGFVFDPLRPQPSGTVPLYSWYHPGRGDNFVSSDPRWRIPVSSVRWAGEHLADSSRTSRSGYRIYRLEGFVYDPRRPQPPGTLPLYSWWHPGRSDNYATTKLSWSMNPRDISWGNEHIVNGYAREGYRLYRLEGYVKSPGNTPESPWSGMAVTSAGRDVNRCAITVARQFNPVSGLNLSRIKRTVQFELDVDWPRAKHVQGVARLRDSGNEGRIAVFENVTPEGFWVGYQPIENAQEAAFSSVPGTVRRRPFDIRSNPSFGNYGHPGGAQALGDFVITGMQNGPPGQPGAAFILGVEGERIRFASQIVLDGSRGERLQRERPSQAGSAALTKLADGNYLAAIYDDAGDDVVIWFYRSDRPRFERGTRWAPAGSFRPACKAFGTENDSCFGGGQGGMNFVTDCDGTLHLVTMDGEVTGNIGRRSDDHWYQVWRVGGGEDGVRLTKVTQQRAGVGDRPQQTNSFRWSGHTYIDEVGNVHLAASERQTGPSIIRASRGKAFGIMSRSWNRPGDN